MVNKVILEMQNLVSNIDAIAFLKEWRFQCKESQERILTYWSCTKDYTSCAFDIIREVARNLDLRCYTEYYSLDAVLYKSEDRVPGIPDNNTWLRRIRIAIEHENVFNHALYQEVSHLTITNCDLRVLITYHNNEEERKEVFERLHEVVAGNYERYTIADNKSFLIITGWHQGSEVVWNGWAYGVSEWELL